ncbi:MAG TPA: hypothetical protein VG457_08255 [Planctomycetota bacterium]|jgi:hypothetical protein|nr:hypothetical protein [Planctomycetota bacterium]
MSDHPIRAVPTLAALRTITNHHDGDIAHVVVSGSEELYYFVAAATNADDGFIWIKPTAIVDALPGRWKLAE